MDFHEEDNIEAIVNIRNNRSQMFFKIAVINILQYSQENKVACLKASHTDLKNSYTGVFL